MLSQQQLSDLWEIQTLKARYFRFMDLRMWTEWRSLFSDDYVLYIDHASNVPRTTVPVFTGADALVRYLSTLDSAGKVTIHHGHMPEIEFLDEHTAVGIWAMYDWVDDPGVGSAFQGYGHYHERYRREPDHGWRIAESRLTRLRTNAVPHLASQQDSFLDRATMDELER